MADGLYRFDCPTPKAHHGYGHSWEACFHPVDVPPAVKMALTVATAQVQRGEQPTPNITAVLVWYLGELLDGPTAAAPVQDEAAELDRMNRGADRGEKHADDYDVWGDT